MKSHLACVLVMFVLNGSALAQLLPRAPGVSHSEKPSPSQEVREQEEARQLLDQILDLNWEDVPYLPGSSGWGGTLLPDQPNRVPEHKRIYPPGYLKRRQQQQVEAVQ